jgi:DinB superfamily
VAIPGFVGEGYVCAECGLDYRELDVRGVGIAGLVEEFAAAVGDARQPGLRPGAEVWSVAEYACHVRDVLMTYTIRLHRARVEDEPRVEPMYNDLRARRFSYQNADVAAVVAQARDAAHGLAAEIARVEDWDRTVSRLPGETRTARWLVRQAVHELRHHTADIRAQG